MKVFIVLKVGLIEQWLQFCGDLQILLPQKIMFSQPGFN